MERVTMTSHKCLAGTNILADQDQKEEVKPLTPRSKRMALVAKTESEGQQVQRSDARGI